MATNPSTYLHIYPGQGSVWDPSKPVKLSDMSNEQILNAIGTSSCITSVGVYIPMDDKLEKCFVAQIVALVGDPQGNMKAWCPGVLYPSENAVSDALKDAVVAALKQDPMIKKHYDREARAARKKHSIIVCPIGTLGLGNETRYTTGHDIIRGIREFFEVPQLKISAGHGFARQSGKDGAVSLFGWLTGDELSPTDFQPMLSGKVRPPEKRPEIYGWVPCNQDERDMRPSRGIKQFGEVPEGPWSFVYRGGKWERNNAASSEGSEDQEA